MSRFSVSVQPAGKDQLSVHASYVDQFRHQRSVSPISIAPFDPATPQLPAVPLIQDDRRVVLDILHGFAEAAWAAGWRPANLDAKLVETVRNHKLPPLGDRA